MAGVGFLIASVPDLSIRFTFIMGKRRYCVFSTVFDRILFMLAGKNDIRA